jgi:dCTP deaminase
MDRLLDSMERQIAELKERIRLLEERKAGSLSAQSIMALCTPTKEGVLPMIYPFVDHKEVLNGKSYGLTAASYDIRIAEDLVLGPDPGKWLLKHVRNHGRLHMEEFIKLKPAKALASTIEQFAIPNNVRAVVCDKSSFARVFVSAFNTLFDPGFHGYGTLELVNHGDEEVVIHAGDPICQITFDWLDEPTILPYNGKYQNQEAGPQEARYEMTPAPVPAPAPASSP